VEEAADCMWCSVLLKMEGSRKKQRKKEEKRKKLFFVFLLYFV
jgi:hypothetical protein